MNKNIVAFDVETTGLSFTDDYVIQLSAVKFDKDFNIIGEFDEMIKPINDFEIAEGALEKHGFTKEFVLENGKPLSEVGQSFIDFINDCNMLSYNGKGFDIKMLTKDFRLVGLEFDLNRVFFDSYLLETKLNPRKLENVYKNYTGKILDNAHNALYDVYATIEIFKHQLDKFNEQDISIDDIMGFDESVVLCIDGMIRKDGDKIVFAKGKYKDIEFMEVTKTDVSYIKWFMNNPEFDIHTKNVVREYYYKNRTV